MIHSPRLTRKPIKIDENGYLNISELLAEMKLEGKDCLAYGPSGDRKITLAIKPSTGSQQGATKISVTSAILRGGPWKKD